MEVDVIKPNFQDFEVELEAIQVSVNENDGVEKHTYIRDRYKKELKAVQNHI